jgi:hypothetical protein
MAVFKLNVGMSTQNCKSHKGTGKLGPIKGTKQIKSP